MASGAEPITPVYATDDTSVPDFLRVSLAIPNLQVKRKLSSKGIKPIFTKVADGATVDVTFKDSSLVATVTGEEKGSLKGKCYQLKIQQLPKNIVARESYSQVKEGRLLLYLKKEKSESWYPELENGLEAFEEEEEEGEGTPSEPRTPDIK